MLYIKHVKTKPSAGEVFGRLTVTGHNEATGKVICQCECGKIKEARAGNLIHGGTRSCGCLRSENSSKKARTHGGSETSLYLAWSNMRRRCNCKTSTFYKDYGGRGIKVCEEWDDFATFKRDMGDRPSGMTIDRIDNDKGYSKDNCKWSTPKEQNRNRRRKRLITAFGQTKCMAQWVEETGIGRSAIEHRIKSGKSVEFALSKPSRKTDNRKT